MAAQAERQEGQESKTASGMTVMKQERLLGGRARTDMNGGSGREGKVTDTQGGEGHKKREEAAHGAALLR